MKLRSFDRRTFIGGAAALLTAGVAAKLYWEYQEAFERAAVFVGAAPGYESNLEDILRRAFQELGIGREWVRGKSVMLKPNMVEPGAGAPHANTHPLLVVAAVEVFRSLDAREVFVAEGQANCRDTYWVLDQSGMGPTLEQADVPFVDLNHDEVFACENTVRLTSLPVLYLPRSLKRADLVVSMPKMKTHHWAGVTLSLKNLFGVMPGICYGWPKNVLHYAGIPESILDIAGAVRPQLAIVDGIVGMEGDGPLMGTPKSSGVVVVGRNLPAVDATAARLMRVSPRRIAYLSRASGLLGPVSEGHIEQRGEPLAGHTTAFELPRGF